MKSISVAILGATGAVGQKFVHLLRDHPFFSIQELVASERSAGKPYHEACHWLESEPIPQDITSIPVLPTSAELKSSILFSGLDSSVAGELEQGYAEKGHIVISNAQSHRMNALVPLVIPEINWDHLPLVRQQGTKGKIITNSNCVTMFLTLALAPLHQNWGIEAVNVTSLNAVSGAGYPGVASLDILGNIIPYIKGEEDKVETEPQKILGTLTAEGVRPADFPITAQCMRVPVINGHLSSVSVQLQQKASIPEIKEAMQGFSGPSQVRTLHSAPHHPIILTEEVDRPQPRIDTAHSKGMVAIVGRVRPCTLMDVKFIVCGHNTVRGAAGAAIFNAESYLAAELPLP